MDNIELWTLCTTNNIVIEKEQIWQLKRYEQELLYWNQKVNLISRKDEDFISERHILHSLSILKYINIPRKSKCLDIGTGGGLPGIPISIANPEINMLLVDSIQKKIKMTDMFAKHTGIRTIQAIRARVEDLAKEKKYLNYFDFIFSRAVTTIDNIILWTNKLIKPTTKIVLLKGGDLTDEIYKTKDIYPKLHIQTIPIIMLGADWFEKDEKKIIVCTFN